MSVQAITWAYAVEGIADPIEAFVLVTLANFADDYGVAFPKVGTLQAACRCSRRKVQYALAALEERGLIICAGRRRANGQQTSSAYLLVGFEGRKLPATAEEHPLLAPLYLEGRLSLDTIGVHRVHPAEAAHQDANGAHVVHGEGAHGARGGCTSCTHGGAHGAHHEPSLEPSLEPPLQPARAGERAERPVRRSADATGAALLEGAASSSEIAAWLEHRRALDMPEISAKAARVLAGELREIRARGVDPDAALRLARSRGWRTVRADWLGGSVS